MGYLLGNSAFLQPRPSPLSSSSSSSSPLLLRSHRKAAKKKKKAMAMASLKEERTEDGRGFSKRRSLVFVGVSALPFLQLRAMAAEDPAKALAGISQESRFATIFVSPRNRNKDTKVKNLKLLDQPKLEVSDEKDKEKLEAQGAQQTEKVISSEKEIPSENEIPSGGPTEVLKSEQVVRQTPSLPGYPFVSLLNAIGIIASGVLGALYATSQKEKTAMESAIKSMNTKLTEREAATAVLKEDFEKRLLKEQEEHRKQVRKLEKEAASLLSRSSSANGTVAALGRELNTEKKVAVELKSRISQLESSILQAEEDKKKLEAQLKQKIDAVEVLQDRVSLLSLELTDKEKNIENLKFLLTGKESECRNLSSIIEQAREDLIEANTTAEQLKKEILKTREELNSKESSIDDLHANIKALNAEKSDTDKKFHHLMQEYEDLKSSTERRIALDSELLLKKDDQLHQLEEKLSLALSEASSKQEVILELTKQRDDAKALQEKEVKDINKLKMDLKTTQENLAASRLEVSNLSKDLEESKRSHGALTSKLAKVQAEFYEANKLLDSNLVEARSTVKALSDEFVSIKDTLKRTKEELSVTVDELKSVVEDRESLKKELLEIYKKVESTAQELKEERKVVATLNKELEVLGKQMLKDAEARRALEGDLDEATKSLDEMNKSALLLSRELENTNSRTASLEAEKEMLFKSLFEQKNIAKEARENVEDAQNLITRLGSERGNLEKRSKKFEEELASAKGEILRLRRQINMGRESVDDHHLKINEAAARAPLTAKKTVTRRRKGGSSSDVS